MSLRSLDGWLREPHGTHASRSRTDPVTGIEAPRLGWNAAIEVGATRPE